MANEKKRKASAPPKGFNARKKANKYRPLTDKEKKMIMIGLGAVVVIVLLIAIFYDDGSLPIKKGAVVTDGAQQMLSYAYDEETGLVAEEPSEFEEDVLNTNWIVTNLGTTKKPKYFKLGEVEVPDGYYRRQETNKRKQESDFMFYEAGENADGKSYVYVSGMKGAYDDNAKNTLGYLPQYNTSNDVSEIISAKIGGYDANYYYYTATDTDEDDPDITYYAQSVNCYLNAGRNRTICLMAFVRAESEEDYMDENELLAKIEAIAQCIKIEE